MNYAIRQKKLGAELGRAGVDALLITHLPNIRYLCGFSGTAGALLVHAKGRWKPVFVTDGRYTQQAAEEVQEARVVVSRKPAATVACERAQKAGITRLGFEAQQISYSSQQALARLVRGKIRLKPVSGLPEHMRETKDPDEVGQMRAAAALGDDLFQTALSAIRAGVPETLVAGKMEMHARREGAEKMSFDTIVAAGPRSALPHGRASSQPIPASGFIILDYGVILAGYCSDMTRTVHLGRVPKARQSMYAAVREAQLASIEAVRPGVEAGAVDPAGRQLLKKAGDAPYFGHSTGNALVLQVHTSPPLANC